MGTDKKEEDIDMELLEAKLEVNALKHKILALEWFNQDKDRIIGELQATPHPIRSQEAGLLSSRHAVKEQVLNKVRSGILLWPNARQTIVSFVSNAEVDIYDKHETNVRSLENICLELRVNMAKKKPAHSRDFYYRVARCQLSLALYSEAPRDPQCPEEGALSEEAPCK